MTLSIAHIVVHVPAVTPAPAPAELRVVIEKVSEADARSTVVASLVVDVAGLDFSSPQTLQFELPYAGPPEDLAVAATLGADTSRGPAAGDLITAAIVPVVPGAAAHVRLVEA